MAARGFSGKALAAAGAMSRMVPRISLLLLHSFFTFQTNIDNISTVSFNHQNTNNIKTLHLQGVLAVGQTKSLANLTGFRLSESRLAVR